MGGDAQCKAGRVGNCKDRLELSLLVLSLESMLTIHLSSFFMNGLQRLSTVHCRD